MSDASTREPGGRRAALAQRGGRLARYALAFITVVLVINAIVGEKGLLALLQARRDFDAVSRSLERARGENDEMRDQIRRLRADPGAIEELARRDLGLIKPGETLFIIRDVPPQAIKQP